MAQISDTHSVQVTKSRPTVKARNNAHPKYRPTPVYAPRYSMSTRLTRVVALSLAHVRVNAQGIYIVLFKAANVHRVCYARMHVLFFFGAKQVVWRYRERERERERVHCSLVYQFEHSGKVRRAWFKFGFENFYSSLLSGSASFLCAALMSPQRTKQYCPQIEYFAPLLHVW